MSLPKTQLSEQSFSKLSQLALVVELHERQRFSLRKDVANVVSLLTVANASANATVQSKLQELTACLNSRDANVLRKLGVSLGSTAAEKTGTKSVRTYRGQVVEASESTLKTTDSAPTDDKAKKKKIIYRGKVIYR